MRQTTPSQGREGEVMYEREKVGAGDGDTVIGCPWCGLKDDRIAELEAAVLREKRRVDSLHQYIDGLEAELANKREVLNEIAAPGYGLDLTDDMEYRARYWERQALRLQQLARDALKGQGGE
jgi:hypothetical protein